MTRRSTIPPGRVRMNPEFADVPLWEGERLNVVEFEEQMEFYLDWLATYLYRPEPGMPDLSRSEAGVAIVNVEVLMAEAVRSRSWDEELLWRIGPRHADYLYRDRISRILSRVPAHETRVALLQWLFDQFDEDTAR